MTAFTLGERRDLDGVYSPSTTLCSSSPALHTPGPPATPRLQIDLIDTAPFSESFSGLLEDELQHVQLDNAKKSYVIERFTNIKELDPEWDDEDIDEILVMLPKVPGGLPTITEELFNEVDNVKEVGITDFELLEPTLHLCRKRDTGKIFVLKSFPEYEKSGSCEKNILKMLKSLDAPFLPQVHWFFRGEGNIHVIMEYYPRNTLMSLVVRHGAFNSTHTLVYASEIAEAISALHATGIIHRNLNPESVIVDADGHIIITGFEFAKFTERSIVVRDNAVLDCTLKDYRAPELLLGWAHSFSVDCWGFGILLHFMLSGTSPFRRGGDDQANLQNEIIHNPIILYDPLEPSAQDLIKRCLERNPAIRPSINAIGRHPYFSKIDWDNVAAKRSKVPRLFQNATTSFSKSTQHLANDDKPTSTISPKPHVDKDKLRNIVNTNDIESSSHKVHAKLAPTVSQQLKQPQSTLNISSLLDNTSNKTHTVYQTKADLSVQSVLTLNDVPANGRTTEASTQDRMNSFWEMLDSENPRPRKLRKARSTIYSNPRFSTLSTFSLQDKLRRKWRSSSGLPLSQDRKELSTVHFSNDIKQIGNGIGFTYTMPAATMSKASICTTTPRGCHGIFHGGIAGLGRLRLGNGTVKDKIKSKTKGRRTLSLTTSEPLGGDSTFMQDFGSPYSNFVSPVSLYMGSASPITSSASNSPILEAGPVTPDATYIDAPRTLHKNSFENKTSHETGNKGAGTTLRLVSSSTSRLTSVPTSV